jgi:hypothetical protein
MNEAQRRAIQNEKNKVVTTIPRSPTTGVVSYDWREGASAQERNVPRGADQAERVGSLVTTARSGVPAYDYSSEMRNSTPGANAAYNASIGRNQSGAPVSVDPYAAYGGLDGLIQRISGSGSGSGSAGKDSALDWAKWNAQQSADATAAATQLRALQGLQARLASGGYRGNADTLLGLIDEQNRTGQGAIGGNYTSGMTNIGQGYDTARGMMDIGYGGLNSYLAANQINPYANLQQQVSPSQNAMQSYLDAYGVSNDPVNQQVQASNISNQQAADFFNQLQALQSANQLSNNQSGIDVARMAQLMANTGLGAQRAGYESNAALAQQQAMNQLADQINQARYGVEEDVGTRKTNLEEAIINAGGQIDGSIAGPSSTGTQVKPGSATSRAEQVKAAPDNYPNFKAALADLNPNYKFTTMAAAKKDFKNLAAAFKK